MITGGQVHDATQASAWLEGQTAGAVIADKAYDSNGFREQIAGIKAEAVIIPSLRLCEDAPAPQQFRSDDPPEHPSEKSKRAAR